MTGMNVWNRATLAIVRKPVRSGIIGLLMLMVFTSLVAQVGVSTALQKMSDDIGRSMGIGFYCRHRRESCKSKGSEPVLAHPRRRKNRLRA